MSKRSLETVFVYVWSYASSARMIEPPTRFWWDFEVAMNEAVYPAADGAGMGFAVAVREGGWV